MPSRFPCLKLGEIRIGKSRFPPKCLDHPSVSRAVRTYSGRAEWYDELVLLLTLSVPQAVKHGSLINV